MARREFSVISNRLSVNQILDELESVDEGIQEAIIYAVPPLDGNDTDEDSAASDDENFDLVHLGRGLLSTDCEVQVRGDPIVVHSLRGKAKSYSKTNVPPASPPIPTTSGETSTGLEFLEKSTRANSFPPTSATENTPSAIEVVTEVPPTWKRHVLPEPAQEVSKTQPGKRKPRFTFSVSPMNGSTVSPVNFAGPSKLPPISQPLAKAVKRRASNCQEQSSVPPMRAKTPANQTKPNASKRRVKLLRNSAKCAPRNKKRAAPRTKKCVAPRTKKCAAPRTTKRAAPSPYKWKKKEPNFKKSIPCNPKDPSEEAYKCSTPFEFFSLFFSNDLMDLIVNQTNRYATQKGKNLNLTKDELYTFFGCLLVSGYSKCPNKRMYWSSEADVPPIIQDSMRCNRFEEILRNLHLVDNAEASDDRLFKLRPLILHLKLKFYYHGFLEVEISIDESMIPYYGRHFAKQYIRGKPIRFSFKNWALCTASGYLIDFDIYTGKTGTQNSPFGLGGDVVLSLLEGCIPPNKGYKTYFDNYFTSVKLMKYLYEVGYQCTGTIREVRTEQCPLPGKKALNKKVRGSYDYRSCDEVLLVQWKDNSVVTIATNHENLSLGSASRWSVEKKAKVAVPRPTVFETYNRGMGGVDQLDQLVAGYRTRMRQKKWWWPIFCYLFDASVVNAYKLMRKLCPNLSDAQNLLSFRRNLALTILKKFGTPSQKGKRPREPSKELRYDGSNHWIEHINTMRRCQECPGKAKFICGKCNVGLHPECFKDYHDDSPLDYTT